MKKGDKFHDQGRDFMTTRRSTFRMRRCSHVEVQSRVAQVSRPIHALFVCLFVLLIKPEQ